MSFAAIKDQETAIQLLKNVLRRKRVPNALLFWGPEGVGKRRTAVELAKALNCRGGPADDACDTCLSCRKVAHGNHPDVWQETPKKSGREIHLEDVESMAEMANLRPFEGPWRVFILQDADRINPRAQNRLLKTLEEPLGNKVFILVTGFPRMLFPTIRSRCQLVRFRRLRKETIVALLKEQRDLPEELAESIALIAQGQMARALELVDSERREQVLSITRRLAEGYDPVVLAEEFADALEARRKQVKAEVDAQHKPEDPSILTPEELKELEDYCKAIAEAKYKGEVLDYLYLLETWYRDQLVYATVGEEKGMLNRDQMARLNHETSRDPGAKVLAVETARRYLDRHVSEERVFRELFFVFAAA